MLINKGNKSNTTLMNLTYENEWLSGATVDPTTGIVTLTAHGLVNYAPVGFQAGAGAIPTGWLAYNSDNIGGTYYNLKYLAADTFQICTDATLSTVVIPTDAGTSGWQIKKMGISSADITGLDLAVDGGYDILITDIGLRRSLNGSNSAGVALYLNGTDPNYDYIGASTSYDSSGLILDAPSGKRYILEQIEISLRYVSDDTVSIFTKCRGSSSDNKSVDTLITNFAGTLVKNVTDNITFITLSASSAFGLLSDGFTVQVWRV